MVSGPLKAAWLPTPMAALQCINDDANAYMHQLLQTLPYLHVAMHNLLLTL
jgi:hypothetical protein